MGSPVVMALPSSAAHDSNEQCYGYTPMPSVASYLGTELDYSTAERICCDNHRFAEYRGYLEAPEVISSRVSTLRRRRSFTTASAASLSSSRRVDARSRSFGRRVCITGGRASGRRKLCRRTSLFTRGAGWNRVV